MFDELLGPTGMLKDVARVLVTHDMSLLDLGSYSTIDERIETFQNSDVKEVILQLSKTLQEMGGAEEGQDVDIDDKDDETFRAAERTMSTSSRTSRTSRTCQVMVVVVEAAATVTAATCWTQKGGKI